MEINNFDLVEIPGITKGLVWQKTDGLSGNFRILRPIDEKRYIIDGPFKLDVKVKRLHGKKLIAQWLVSLEEQTNKFLNNIYKPESGADPEIFAKSENGEILTADKWLPDIEKIPLTQGAYDYGTAKYKYTGTRVYKDGVLAEFATLHRSCLSSFADEIQVGLVETDRALKMVFPTAKLTMRNLIELTPEQMIEIPQQSLELGCAPSFNAYTGRLPILEGTQINIRSAGGHIHLGFQPRTNTEKAAEIVRGMDVILGICGTALAGNMDDSRRRIYYGRAGEYRLPPHGLEYRVLSNFWLCHPAIMHLVFEIARVAYKASIMGLWKVLFTDTLEVPRIINETDFEAARRFVIKNERAYRMLFREMFIGMYLNAKKPTDKTFNKAYEVVLSGVKSVVKDVEDFENNWFKGWLVHSESKYAQWQPFAEQL